VYGTKESLESYCAHLLLSRDVVYFVKVESRDYSMYQPRSPAQVYFLNIRVTNIMLIFQMILASKMAHLFIVASSQGAVSS